MSKIQTKQITLVSPNGLVEKTIDMDDSGVVKVNGVQVADTVSGVWTPIPIVATGSITSYTSVGTYVKIGKLVYFYCRVHITAIGTASGTFSIGGLPFSEAQPYPQIVGIEIAQTGTLIRAYIQNSTLQTIVRYDGVSVLANNYMYVFNGVYEV